MPLASTINTKVYDIIQHTGTPVTISSSTTLATFGIVNFYLNLLDQATQLAAVFDQYRVMMMEVSVLPRVNTEYLPAVNTGLLTTVIDYDDSTALTTTAQAYDYENALTGRGLDPQKRTFIPHIAVASYSGSFTSYANRAQQWIDCSSGGVFHYGLKTAWSPTDAVYTCDLVTRVWMQFRNVR